MSGLVSAISKMKAGQFAGFMLSIDSLPPYTLWFTFAPERIEDHWEAEMESHSHPGSRYSYPIFKQGTLRTVTFTLKFDAAYPTVGSSETHILKTWGIGESFWGHMKAVARIQAAVAIIEKFKLPKQGIAQIFQSAMGSLLKVRPGTADPAPPLIALALNPTKFYLGYLPDAKIRQVKFDRYMFCTRIEVDCKFIVSPDLIFTTVEDLQREVYAAMGWGV